MLESEILEIISNCEVQIIRYTNTLKTLVETHSDEITEICVNRQTQLGRVINALREIIDVMKNQKTRTVSVVVPRSYPRP